MKEKNEKGKKEERSSVLAYREFQLNVLYAIFELLFVNEPTDKVVVVHIAATP